MVDIIQIAMTQKAPLLKNNKRTAIFASDQSNEQLLIAKALDSEMFKTVHNFFLIINNYGTAIFLFCHFKNSIHY